MNLRSSTCQRDVSRFSIIRNLMAWLGERLSIKSQSLLSGEAVRGSRCSISHSGLCRVFSVLLNVCTVNFQEGARMDAPRTDLTREPFDHGLSHGPRIWRLTFSELLVHSKLGDLVDFRLRVSPSKFMTPVTAVAILFVFPLTEALGVEPRTTCTPSMRSTTELYPRRCHFDHLMYVAT